MSQFSQILSHIPQLCLRFFPECCPVGCVVRSRSGCYTVFFDVCARLTEAGQVTCWGISEPWYTGVSILWHCGSLTAVMSGPSWNRVLRWHLTIKGLALAVRLAFQWHWVPRFVSGDRTCGWVGQLQMTFWLVQNSRVVITSLFLLTGYKLGSTFSWSVLLRKALWHTGDLLFSFPAIDTSGPSRSW